METSFIEIVLQEFMQEAKIDTEVRLRNKLIESAETSFIKELNEKQVESYKKIKDLYADESFHELERLTAFIYHLIQI